MGIKTNHSEQIQNLYISFLDAMQWMDVDINTIADRGSNVRLIHSFKHIAVRFMQKLCRYQVELLIVFMFDKCECNDYKKAMVIKCQVALDVTLEICHYPFSICIKKYTILT